MKLLHMNCLLILWIYLPLLQQQSLNHFLRTSASGGSILIDYWEWGLMALLT